jgi:hypothetical protein
MRHFQQIAGGVDVLPLLHAIALQPHLWNADRTRTWHPQSAHRVVDDILLRYNEFNPERGDDFVERVCSEIACVNMPAFAALPQAQPIVFALMARVCGEHLGRVFISRMAPGICIPPHTDRIAPAEEAFPGKVPPAVYFARYQIPLKAQPGVVFRAGDESVFMEPGTVWWFDNCVEHEVQNHSQDDRISLVLDIRPFRP